MLAESLKSCRLFVIEHFKQFQDINVLIAVTSLFAKLNFKLFNICSFAIFKVNQKSSSNRVLEENFTSIFITKIALVLVSVLS